MLEWLRFGLTVVFIMTGLFILAIGLVGQFRFRYVLNRMHAASMGDSLGLPLILCGLCISSNDGWMVLKMLMMVLFLWVASPTGSHLIARLEATTNNHLNDWMEVRRL